MKRTVVILVCSLAANAALYAALAIQPSLAPPQFRSYFESSAAQGRRVAAERAAETKRVEAQVAREEAARAATERQLWARLSAGGPTEMVARLRAAGFSADLIRAIVGAEIEAQFVPRYRELGAKMFLREFWRVSPSVSDPKLQEEAQALYRERTKALRAALADDFVRSGGEANAAMRERYGNLDRTKVDLLQLVEQDYAEMTSQLRSSLRGMTLPEDREKFALLEREKLADLAAVLSPEELTEYRMRSSPVTMRLRPTMTIMDATEQEFRAVYGVMDKFADVIYPTAGFLPAEYEKRRQAQQQANDELKSVLGDERYADFRRANDADYQSLHDIVRRENVPIATANQAYALRETTIAESQRIANDRSLTPDAKVAGLRALAQNTRTQLNAMLGQAAGTAYGARSMWLRYIDMGAAVTVGPDGIPVYRTIVRGRPNG